MDLCLRVKSDFLRIAHLIDEIDGVITLEELEELLTILDNEKPEFVSPEIRKMAETVSDDSSLWPLLVTQSHRQVITDIAIRAVKMSLSNHDSMKYMSTWLRIRKFLDNLGRAHIIPKPWSLFRQKHVSMSGNSFDAAIMSGKLARSIYSTAGSSTGRLTVTAGPNFLIAPAEVRSALCESNESSSVVIIDFSSMEPRAILAMQGIKTTSDDIYQDLMDMCNIDSRATAKLATISALYGASEMRLTETVGSKQKAKSLIESVRGFFNMTELEQQLETQAAAGIVRNFFGRPLHDATRTPRLRVNHFAQSTAAELSVLLFADLCDAVPSATPLFVIHDALIVEIPNCDMEALTDASQNLTFQGAKFPTTLGTV